MIVADAVFPKPLPPLSLTFELTQLANSVDEYRTLAGGASAARSVLISRHELTR